MFSVQGGMSWENPETASHGQLKPDLGFPHCLLRQTSQRSQGKCALVKEKELYL